MTEDGIERYDTFNTKGCLEDLIFGDFNDQPIPSTYSDLTYYHDDDGTQIDAALMGNEGLDNKVLPPERKGYILRNPLNVNYSDKRATRLSMVWNNLIVGSNEIHSVAKSYVNVVNAITSFVKPTPPTNIITN